MQYLNEESIFYLGIIVLILIFLIWTRGKNRRRKNTSFRKRYQEKKRENKK